MLPVSISGNRLKIAGKEGSCIITAPENTNITLEEVGREKKGKITNIHRRIRIRKTTKSGELKIYVRFTA